MSLAARSLGAALVFAWALSAADLTGIWMGEVAGKNGEKQDLAFQFQSAKGAIAGVMFGDEFDLKVQNLRIDGDRIEFSVTSTDYYNGHQTKTSFTGKLTGDALELTREQSNPDPAKTSKQTILLKRI